MPIQHLTELFALDGRAFVTEAYRNLLNREPDEHGLAYYLGRLSAGYGKAAVIAQLAQAPGCRPLDEIKGLKKLIADEQRARHWFWGAFGQRSRVDRTLQGILESLRGAMLTQAEQAVSLATQAARLPSTSGGDSSTRPVTVIVRNIHDLLALDLEDAPFIEAAYQAILRRPPDPEGLAQCLHALQTGTDKTVLIRDLAVSPEAWGVAEKLPGLGQWLTETSPNAISLPHQARGWLRRIAAAAALERGA